MAETETPASDMSVGLATLFVLIAAAGALLTFLSPAVPLAGWGFAAAMTAGALAVAAVHLYW